MNLGIGTLALYKKNMNEASVLKVREYVSRGIPFIKAYYDTDIDNIPELSPFYLNFPNNDSLIDVNKIIEFLTSVSKSELDISNIMHKIAVEKLDWSVKMKEYVDFVNKKHSRLLKDKTNES